MRRFLLPLLATACALTGLSLARATAPAATPAVKKWAVIVGVNNHQGRTHDNIGAVGDAALFRDMLKKNGWPADHILTISDAGATAGHIRNALKWLVARSTPDSFSVFHYSGHVKQKAANDGDNESLDEHLWPSDNQHISDGELASYLKRLKGHAWIDFAGCEAIGLDDGISSRTRLVTASSREDEKSYEVPSWKKSLMTGLFIEQGLMLAKATDGNRDGKISIQEAFAFAAEHAPRLSAKQSKGPQHPQIRGGDGTQWLLQTKPPPRPYQCKLVTDRADDAVAFGMRGAPYADIVSADVASGRTTVTALIRVADLKTDWRTLTGVEYRLSFTMAGARQVMTARRSAVNGDSFTLHSAYVGGASRLTAVSGRIDTVTKTVRIVAPRSAFFVEPRWRWYSNLAAETFVLDGTNGALGIERADAATSKRLYYDKDPSCVKPA